MTAVVAAPPDRQLAGTRVDATHDEPRIRLFATVHRTTVSDDRRSVHAIARVGGAAIELRAPVRFHADDGDGLTAWTGPGAVLLALPPARPVEVRGTMSSFAPLTVAADTIITTRTTRPTATVAAAGTVVPSDTACQGWRAARLHLPGGEVIPIRTQLDQTRSGRWSGVLTFAPVELRLQPADDHAG